MLPPVLLRCRCLRYPRISMVTHTRTRVSYPRGLCLYRPSVAGMMAVMTPEVISS